MNKIFIGKRIIKEKQLVLWNTWKDSQSKPSKRNVNLKCEI